mmetsp:Transcript_34699/g.110853  ORF Transcript_34699/g.110853 Transcript_34699/m.110853 type:complete len:178 (-) Transcript_34699:107-640(-)
MLLPFLLLHSAVSLPARRAVIGRAASLALGAGAGLAPVLAVSEISETVLVPPSDPASPTPQRAQKVSVDYTLWIGGFDKKQIDSSKGSAFPPRLPAPFVFSVGVGEVIPGWDRTVKQMRAGETRRVVVPASLGYGEKGIGPIPGGADLYFEISLLELKSPPKLTEQQLAWLSSHAEP